MVMLSDYVVQTERQCLREVIQGYLDGKDLCSMRAFKLMEMDFIFNLFKNMLFKYVGKHPK